MQAIAMIMRATTTMLMLKHNFVWRRFWLQATVVDGLADAQRQRGGRVRARHAPAVPVCALARGRVQGTAVGAGRLPSDSVLQELTRGYLLSICEPGKLHGFVK